MTYETARLARAVVHLPRESRFAHRAYATDAAECVRVNVPLTGCLRVHFADGISDCLIVRCGDCHV
jgi:hypothetical protein